MLENFYFISHQLEKILEQYQYMAGNIDEMRSEQAVRDQYSKVY